MKIQLLFIVLSMVTSAFAADQWRPEEHPAKLQRFISAFTEPSELLEIKAEYSARLTHFLIDENSKIASSAEGKVLIARQDSRFSQLEVSRAEAALVSQKQLLKLRLAQKETQQREIKYRLKELNRARELIDEKSISARDFDLAEFEYDRSKLALIELENNIALQKKAIVEQQMVLETAQEKLSRHNIYAPSGWVLNKKMLEPGTMLTAGMVVCRLVNLQELSLYFRLNEEELTALRSGPIEVRMVATGTKVAAKLHRIDYNFDPISRKRQIELRLDAQGLKESSGGLEAELLLSLDYPQEAVEVPLIFTQKKLEQYFVKFANGKQVAVVPLRRDDEKIIIRKSLLPTGTVLVKF